MPRFNRAFRRTAAKPSPQPVSSRLTKLDNVGSNPGNLAAYLYTPPNLVPGSALVVVLHGCTQTASGYDHGSGWSALAEANGFAVLYPEQQRVNNANLCFNWFVPGHIARGGGEAESIRQMVLHSVAAHELDADRVFVTGLSAGGAMAAVMLAAYPEVFAGGAILGGLPYGAATTLPDALAQMRGRPAQSNLAATVHAAAPRPRRHPTVSIWHGSNDNTVHADNAAATLEQWLGVHGLDAADGQQERVAGHLRSVWRDASGRDVVEAYTISGMGHGTPLDTSGGCGVAGPFMLEAGISSTERIAAFWGIAAAAPASRPVTTPQPRLALASPQASRGESRSNVQKIIEDALRKAGLMK